MEDHPLDIHDLYQSPPSDQLAAFDRRLTEFERARTADLFRELHKIARALRFAITIRRVAPEAVPAIVKRMQTAAECGERSEELGPMARSMAERADAINNRHLANILA